MSGLPTKGHETDIIARYVGGESTCEIARSFGVCRQAIALVLKKRGVPRRPSGRVAIGAQKIAEAKRLYAAGLSTHSIARRLRIGQETVRSNLIYAGVTLRSPSAAIGLAMRARA